MFLHSAVRAALMINESSERFEKGLRDAKAAGNALISNAEKAAQQSMAEYEQRLASCEEEYNSACSKATIEENAESAKARSRYQAAVDSANAEYDLLKKRLNGAAARALASKTQGMAELKDLQNSIDPKLMPKIEQPKTVVPKEPDYPLLEDRLKKINDNSLWARIKSLIQIDGFFSRKAMIADFVSRIADGKAFYSQQYDEIVSKSRQSDQQFRAQKESKINAAQLQMNASIDQAKSVRAIAVKAATKKRSQDVEAIERDWSAAQKVNAVERQDAARRASALLRQAELDGRNDFDGLDIRGFVTAELQVYREVGGVTEPWNTDYVERVNPDWITAIAKCRIKLNLPGITEDIAKSKLGGFLLEDNQLRDLMLYDVTSPQAILFEYGSRKSDVISAIQFMVAQRILTVPIGMSRVLYFDPYDKGTSIGRLNILSSPEDGGDPILIEKVITSSAQVEGELRAVVDSLGEIGQKVGPYQKKTLREYNDDDKNCEKVPYLTIILNDIQSADYTDSALGHIESILRSAQQFGISVIATCGEFEDAEDKRRIGHLKSIARECSICREDKHGFEMEKAHVELFNFDIVSDEYLASFAKQYRDVLRERGEVIIDADICRFINLDGRSAIGPVRHIDNANPAPGSSSDGTISIPIGVGLDNRLIEFAIGRGPDYHALVTGTIGSGKSVFLHSLINGIATNYSPDEVELWLVDFKGVEFAQYELQPLPHIRLIGLTEDEEFAENLLEKIEAEFGKINDGDSRPSTGRRRVLEAENVKNINQYNALEAHLPGNPDYMRHVILVIDEFSVLCSYLNRKPGRQEAFARVLKLYRAAGLYCIFANQSILVNSSLMLPKDTLEQISSRIVFHNIDDDQCTRMFSSGWPAEKKARSLPAAPQLQTGQFIMQNQQSYLFGQSAWYTDSEDERFAQDATFAVSTAAEQDYGASSLKVVNERIRQPFDMDVFDSELLAMGKPAEDAGLRLLLGTSCSLLADYCSKTLCCKDFENAIVIGNEEKLRADVVCSMIISSVNVGGSALIISAPTSSCHKRLESIAKALALPIEDSLKSLCSILLEAEEQIIAGAYSAKLIVLNSASELITNGTFPASDKGVNPSLTSKVANSDAMAAIDGYLMSGGQAESTKSNRLNRINAMLAAAEDREEAKESLQTPTDTSSDNLTNETIGSESAYGSFNASGTRNNSLGLFDEEAPITREHLSETFFKIMKVGPRFGIHIVWNEQYIPAFGDRDMFGPNRWYGRMLEKAFQHRFATAMGEERASRSLGFDDLPTKIPENQQSSIVYYADASNNVDRFRPFEMPWS